MPGTYNSGLNYLMLTIKEKNGQFEHTTEVVIEATDITEAKAKAQRIVQTWYEANPYCCGFIFLFKDEVSVEVETIVTITPVEFFERAIIGT
jgi:hypothetical protein